MFNMSEKEKRGFIIYFLISCMLVIGVFYYTSKKQASFPVYRSKKVFDASKSVNIKFSDDFLDILREK